MVRPLIFNVVDFEANVRWYPVSMALSVPADDLECLTYMANSNGNENITGICIARYDPGKGPG